MHTGIRVRRHALSLFFFLLITLVLSILLVSNTARADEVQPTYTLDRGKLITAKGGFIDNPNVTSNPMFVEVNGEWIYGGANDSRQDGYYSVAERAIYFIYDSDADAYITHSPFVNLNPIAGCDIAIQFPNTTSNKNAKFVGVTSLAPVKITDDCTEKVQSLAGLSSSPVFDNLSDPTGEEFLGVTIPTCAQRPGTAEYSACKTARDKALRDLANAIRCDTTSPSGIKQCEYYKSIESCLKASEKNTVAMCSARADANAILAGDLSSITADTTDGFIKDLCYSLTNLDKQKQCIKAATEQRDELKAAGAEGEKTSCAVDGIGWIICPLSNSIAKGVDSIYSLVEYFLRVEPLSFRTDSGLYSAWSAIRNIANVAFVLAFLIIIYSQITGGGLSNYGIKKMLPKLVVAAVLVNTSYILCALLVDISNISGSSLQDLLMTIRESAASSTPKQIPSWDIFITSVLSGGAIGGLAFVGLAAAGSFTALLWLAVPVLIAALFSVLVAVLVLAGRQALIIILITLAPLAFVAYLLPNTQKLFDKWKDIFVTLLIMYPLIAIIFGGSQLAASIIMNNADNTIMVFLALAVQFIPLAITPLVIKFSGGLLNRVAGIVNNSQKGLLDRAKNSAKERAELATKKGIASKNPNLLNRMGQRRDFGRRRRKASGETYDAQANENWFRSDTGRNHERTLSDAKLNEQTAQTRANAYAVANRSKVDAIGARVAKEELDMHTKIEEAELEELKVGNLDVRGTNLEGLANEARDNLRETNVAASRVAAAGRVQQKESAEAMTQKAIRINEDTGLDEEVTIPTGLAQRMGGVDPYGTGRAVASATAAIDKQWGENVAAEKTTMSSMGVDNLMELMKDTSVSSERRAAAAGMVMSRGGDQHVQAALDYLGTADKSTDSDLQDIQKQVAHDLGGRKPFALGETDVSTLANGTYAGGYQDKLLTRIQKGKLGSDELLRMGSDELQRVTELASSGKLNDAEHAQLTAAIEYIYANDNITNPNDEKTNLLRSIQAKKLGELTHLEPVNQTPRTARPYGPTTKP